MNSSTYLKESERTASAQFHDEIIDASMLEHVLTNAIKTGELVDVAKKSLFYGKPILAGTGIELAHGKPSTVNPHAVPHDILHAALGLYTESAEILEAVLAGVQGQEFDEVNALEELGDLEWYSAMMYRTLNRTPGDAKAINIRKLKQRFPDKFKTSDAITRDLVAERAILEEKDQ